MADVDTGTNSAQTAPHGETGTTGGASLASTDAPPTAASGHAGAEALANEVHAVATERIDAGQTPTGAEELLGWVESILAEAISRIEN